MGMLSRHVSLGHDIDPRLAVHVQSCTQVCGNISFRLQVMRRYAAATVVYLDKYLDLRSD